MDDLGGGDGHDAGPSTGSPSPFVVSLQEQVEQELTVSRHFASAVWCGAAGLPRLPHHVSEQSVLRFTEERVEEVASPTTLITVAGLAGLAGDDLFHLEDLVVREVQAGGPEDSSAPPIVGH